MATEMIHPPTGWVEFLRAHSRVTRELDAALRSGHGLTLNEYEVLLKLWFADDRRLRRVDLAGQMLITQGGITRMLAGLEVRGLVRRVPSPQDRRVAFAELTADGVSTLEAARVDHLAEVERLFGARFTQAERANLGELLKRLTD